MPVNGNHSHIEQHTSKDEKSGRQQAGKKPKARDVQRRNNELFSLLPPVPPSFSGGRAASAQHSAETELKQGEPKLKQSNNV